MSSKFNSKLFLLILLFSLISKIQMAQCNPIFNSPFPTLTICDAPLDLSAYVTPGSGHHFSSTTPGAYISGNYFYPALSTGVSPYNIAYTADPGCTPSVLITNQYLTVVSTDLLKILSNTSNVTKFTYTPSVGCTLTVANAANYNTFKWFKNGFEIAFCPSCSTLVVDDMGTYTLQAYNTICGQLFQDEVEIACDCDYSGATVIGTTGMTVYLTNTPLAASGGIGHSGIDFVFKGTVIIPAGVNAVISDANVKMMPCSKIIIEAGSGTNGGSLTTINSTITGCDKWQGIIINGDNSVDRTSSNHGLFSTSDGFEISDAYKAFYSDNGGRLEIDHVFFENNENDITLQNYDYFYTPTLNALEFKGKWMHNDIEEFCTIYSYATPFNYIEKNMVYFEDVKDIDLYNCTFIGNDFLDGTNNFKTIGIEIYDAENINLGGYKTGTGDVPLTFTGYLFAGITARYLTNVVNNTAVYASGANYIFDKYYFDEDLIAHKGIVLDNCSTITLGYIQSTPFEANRFLGTIEYAIYVTNSVDIKQYENLFNVNNVTDITGESSSIGQAGYYSNCDNLEVVGSWMADMPLGAYFAGCNNGSNIHSNSLINVTDGYHFGDCDEITIESNVFENSSGYALQFYGQGGIVGSPGTKSLINDNRFIDNNYALIISPGNNPIGTGGSFNDNWAGDPMQIDIMCNLFENNNLAIVGSGDIINQGNGSDTHGNKFDGNIDWDLCWMDFNGTLFEFYETASPGAAPNVGLSPTALTLNGSSISTPSQFTHNSFGKNDLGCFAFLRQANTDHTIKPYLSNNRLLNSLVKNELNIATSDAISNGKNIVCFDALGRIYNLEFISMENGNYKYNTQNLSAGIYYLSMGNITQKFYKL